MRYGIALIGDRVAPRCVFAESVLIVVLRRNLAMVETTMRLESLGLLDLAKVLAEARADVLVCGGISNEEREFLTGRHVDIVDNVAGSVQQLLEALQDGALRSGFGLAGPEVLLPRDTAPEQGGHSEAMDCFACRDHLCLQGSPCAADKYANDFHGFDQEIVRVLEASLDVSSERERTLCRLSELIYFCLEMRYQRLGLAYCVDLQEPAETLARVLRRFFVVHPVCCKIGGVVVSDPTTAPQGKWAQRQVACNPRGQAEVLNRIGTDINVLVGLCIGTDCLFSRFSDAPVTTLFVKDKSLANNPIGAVYSDYYLKEATTAAWAGANETGNLTYSNSTFVERDVWRFRH
jgi:uncharacterized metal-binding protein/predicted Fe-Mo cluster-binding NifX family protein